MTSTYAKKAKNYIKGSAKQFTCSNGEIKINVDLLLEDLLKLPVNEKGYIKIALNTPKGGKDKFGNDFSIYENDYVPDPNKPKKDYSGPTQAGSAITPPVGFPNQKKEGFPF